MKSGNLNFLEPFGPLQACNGTDLPLYIINELPRRRCLEEQVAVGFFKTLQDSSRNVQ